MAGVFFHVAERKARDGRGGGNRKGDCYKWEGLNKKDPALMSQFVPTTPSQPPQPPLPLSLPGLLHGWCGGNRLFSEGAHLDIAPIH